VTFNHDNTYSFFRERIKRLEDLGHDVSDWKAACEKAMSWDETIYTGLYFQNKDRPTLEDLEPVLDEGGPLAFRPLGLSDEQAARVIQRMM
jgi:2-oxoglutarate ferredoxin oxidoreductase subunit beta